MFVRIKKHAGSKNCSVLICHSIRQNGKVQQKVLCRLGVANRPEDLLDLQLKADKQIADLKAAKQKLEEESMPISNTISLDTREVSRQNSGIPDILGKYMMS